MPNIRMLNEMSDSLAHYRAEFDASKLIENLHAVLRRIQNVTRNAEATTYWRGRSPALVAVSKTKSSAQIECCYGAGQMKFGENYIQELAVKANTLKSKCPNIEWHFIGTMQSNKVPKLAEIDNLYCVETICNKKHCSILNREIAKRNRKLNVLVQVNTSNEEQKGGTTPEMALELVDYIRTNCPSLNFTGFMTIGSYEQSVSNMPNEEFEKLFNVRKMFCEVSKENEGDFELSMGMTHDFETAIMQGSTLVRVGTAIFGPRSPKGENAF